MLVPIVVLILGFVLVLKGADFLVEGSSSLAKRLQVPELVIGLTIVAFGTSMPELVVNIFASLSGKSELVLGNIIGSNLFNTLFILGVAGLIQPFAIQKRSIRQEIPFSIVILVVFLLMANDDWWGIVRMNQVDRVEALVLLVLFFLFFYFIIGKNQGGELGPEDVQVMSLWKIWLMIVAGLVGLFVGGKLVVDNAVVIARELGVSEKLIALTIVSAGTSLPELATSAVAAYKKRSDLAIGNVVGSNIFNVLFILGVSGMIAPVQYQGLFNIDILILGGATLILLLAMFMGKRQQVDRWEAFLLLMGYLGYMIYIISRK